MAARQALIHLKMDEAESRAADARLHIERSEWAVMPSQRAMIIPPLPSLSLSRNLSH